jgi:hypothetical protein
VRFVRRFISIIYRTAHVIISRFRIGGLRRERPLPLTVYPPAVSVLVLEAAAARAYWTCIGASHVSRTVFQPAFLLFSVGKTLYQASTGGGGLPGNFLAMPLAAILQTDWALLRAVSLPERQVGTGRSTDVRMCDVCQFR